MDRLELSSAAQEVLNDGFRRNLASREIAQLIRQRTGEAVSGRTVRASEALAGHRPGRAAVPESESEWERHAGQIVRRLRGKLIRGENLNLADAEELGAICKLRGAKNEGGGNEKVFARQSGCGSN